MNSFRPPGERRVFLLWLLFTLGLFGLYYVWPQPTFVRRFEQTYYSVYWNRPLLTTSGSDIAVGIIAPRYISSLVDTEMWIWVRRGAAATPATTDEAPPPSTTPTATPPVSPIVVIDYDTIAGTVTPTPLPTATPDPALPAAPPDAPPPTPTPAPTVEAQMLFRQGENRSDLNTDSRASIAFPGLQPNETAARILWVSLMPLAMRRIEGEDPEYIFLTDDRVSGEVTFRYYLWNDPATPANSGSPLLFGGATPKTEINARKTLVRGFVRTLLLPPWSNGVLVALALLCATLLNSLSGIIEHRLTERRDEQRSSEQREGQQQQPIQQANLGIVEPEEQSTQQANSGIVEPQTTPEAKPPGSRARPILVHWIWQGAYWLCAIAVVVALIIALTERLVLCQLTIVWSAEEPCARFSGWWLVPIAAILGLSVLSYYMGYLARDTTPGSAGDTLRHARSKLPGSVSSGDALRDMGRNLSRTVNLRARLAAKKQAKQEAAIQKQRATEAAAQAQEAADRAQAEQARINFEQAEAARIADTLAADIAELRRTVGRSHPPFPLDDFRKRHKDLLDRANDLSKMTGDRGRGPAAKGQLTSIMKTLGVMASYTEFKQKYEALQSPADAGDATSGQALTDLKGELESFKPEASPVKGPANQLREDVTAAIEKYWDYFVHLHENAHTLDGLVSSLGKLDGIRQADNRLVNFFGSSDLNIKTGQKMSAGDAFRCGCDRLPNHYRVEIARKEDDLLKLPKANDDGSSGEERRTRLLALKESIAGWPETLTGWKYCPTDEQESLRKSIVALRSDIDGN